jgi:cell division protein FtsW (lipid II flippase)
MTRDQKIAIAPITTGVAILGMAFLSGSDGRFFIFLVVTAFLMVVSALITLFKKRRTPSA